MKTSSLIVVLLSLPALLAATPLERFLVGLPVEQYDVLSEVTLEDREQWGFHRCLDLGVIPTDPAGWDEEFQAVFFGNMPPEYHQKYIEAFAKLREANGPYWKVRAELFEILHPHLEMSGLEQQLKWRNESLEMRQQGYENSLARDDLTARLLRMNAVVLHRTFVQFREYATMLEGNYRLAAAEQTQEFEKRSLTINSTVFGDDYPEWLDPDKQTEYWEALAEEIIFRCRITTEALRKQTQEIKGRITELDQANDDADTASDLPGGYRIGHSSPDQDSSYHGGYHYGGYFSSAVEPVLSRKQLVNDLIRDYALSSSGAMSFAWPYFPWIPLNDEQKLRLANDEPLFLSRSTWDRTPSFADYAALRELRDAELEQWKIVVPELGDRVNPPRFLGLFAMPPQRPTGTPELVNLGLYQAQVARWDGSFSLHPLIRAIAERIRGIDMRTLNTPVGLGVEGWGVSIGAGRGPVELTLSVPQLDLSEWNREARGNTPPVTHPALRALFRGEKDIVFSVQLSQAEIDEIQIAEMGDEKVELVIVPFAKDALVFLQNRHNPVRGLTLEQYRGIISGKHTRWTEVGGFGGEIQTMFRYENPESVGLMPALLGLDASVYDTFRSQSYDALTGELPGGGGFWARLGRMPGGIAFTSYQYDRYMAPSTLSRVMSVDGVFPNADTIASGEYPLVYDCVLVHRKDPGEHVEQFVQWLLSEEGQKLVRSVGYVPQTIP